MKIAFLTMHSCPLAQAGTKDTGGMNVYAIDTARELEAKNHTVDIFTRSHANHEEKIINISPQVRLIHVKAGENDLNKESLAQHIDEYVSGIDEFRSSNNLRYDIIHSHYWLSGKAGLSLSRKLSVPHVTSFHTTAALKNSTPINNLEIQEREPSEREIAQKSDRIIAWTHEESESLVSMYGASKKNISVVPIGVDLQLFKKKNRETARNRFGLPANKDLILYLGRLDPIKGPDLFINTVLKLSSRKNLEAWVVGGEKYTYEKQLLQTQSSVLTLDEKIRFFEPIPHQQLPWLYSAADILIVPSYYESFSMVTAESLATGTPVIASDVAGPASLIEDGKSGFLIKPGNATEFASKINYLLDSNKTLENMSAYAPSTVSHLAWPRIIEKIINTYEIAINSPERIPL